MGKQHNKLEKRRRRLSYLKRKKAAAKTKTAKPATVAS
jgi:ribosomal protein S15P/S13E